MAGSKRQRHGLVAMTVGAVVVLSMTVLAPAALATNPPTGEGILDAAPTKPIKDDKVEKKATYKACSMYASANGFGMACNDADGGEDGPSLVSYLNGKPLKECWETAPPPGYEGPARTSPGAYYTRTCVRGLDRTTLRRTGPLGLTYEVVYLPPDQVQTLTPGEQIVIRRFFGSGQIPYPQLQTGPTPEPRVRQAITFTLARSETPALTTQGVTMYATVVQLQIKPGDGSPVITCQGPGRLLTADQITDEAQRAAPDVCDHVYQRSSADGGKDRYRDRYPADVTAYWQVRYRVPYAEDARGYRVVGTYTKSAINQLRVPEVQTFVVS